MLALPTACSSGRRLGRRRVGGFPTGRMRHFHFPHHPGRDQSARGWSLCCVKQPRYSHAVNTEGVRDRVWAPLSILLSDASVLTTRSRVVPRREHELPL